MKKFFVLFLLNCCLLVKKSNAQQQSTLDELFSGKDSTLVLDSLMAGFEDYLDSIYSRKSFFSVSLTAGTALLSYENSNSVKIDVQKRLLLAPSIGYYHKSGFGLNVATYMVNEEKSFTPYQYNFTPSFDLIRKKFSTGIAFTKSILKDSLSFYTTPLQQEGFIYFNYKDWQIRPSLSISYAWGSVTSYNERKVRILKKRLKQSRNIYVRETIEESINDLSLNFSLRKDFNFFGLLSNDDMVSLTPVVMLNCGTQQYGFNTTYDVSRVDVTKVNVLPSNSSITDRNSFTAQSAALILRGAYLYKRFMVQPQFIVDYFIPGKEDQLNSAFSITANVTF
ncbi:MAG: hypothetical protein ACXWV5_11255 [Flavitalea sp.]